MNSIQKKLLEMQDIEYKNFHSKLMPTIDDKRIIGIRVPALRKFAKTLFKQDIKNSFMNNLPHYYYEENNIHAFLIERIDDFDEALEETNKFLPYIDNWATCDMFSPKVFGKNKERLIEEIKKWLSSFEPYTIRYAIGMLMRYFLDEDFKSEYAQWVAAVKSDEYYVKMMKAWYFATALAKQYDIAVTYISNHVLDETEHRMTIQKAIESHRISDTRKQILKKYKAGRGI